MKTYEECVLRFKGNDQAFFARYDYIADDIQESAETPQLLSAVMSDNPERDILALVMLQIGVMIGIEMGKGKSQ